MRTFTMLIVLIAGVLAAGASAVTGRSAAVAERPAGVPMLRLDDTTTIEFAPIAPGRFVMGSTNGDRDERPVHEVTISRGFEMGKHEVTQAQWTAVAQNNPWRWGLKQPVPLDRPVYTPCGGSCPEVRVSWEDVQRFIAALNSRSDGYTYRLPTEAEWEYAARAGTTGDYAGDLYKLGWQNQNSDQREYPAPVGQKQPNAWGLYDVHGNVWEWVSDWYASSYPPAAQTDPTGPVTGKYRVYRGGSWVTRPTECRSASRSWGSPGGRDAAVGFRILRVRTRD